MSESIRTADTTNPLAIDISGLGKAYRIWASPYARLRAWLMEGVSDLARRVFGAKHPLASFSAAQAQRGFREIHALRQVSLQIGRGEVIGIIGYNGSGKSTLLQMIAGTLTPSSGSVAVHGRVAALLELGSGVNPEFTGRENVYLYGAVLGFSRQSLEARMHAIEEFAEIGEAFDETVKTYSTGMGARLAFSVLTQLDPDILIVDEALSVGDAYFQHKSMNLIRQFQQAGKTMLVVSHDLGAIKTMCTRAIILERGVMVREGPAGAVCDYYNALVAKKQKDAEIRQVERTKGQVITRSGDRRLVIGDVELMDRENAPTRSFTVGEEARVACAVEIRSPVDNPTVGLLLRDRLGNDVYGSNTHHQQANLGRFDAGSRCEVVFTLPLNLAPGRYSLTVAVHSGRDHLADNYDWQDNVIVFAVLPGPESAFTGTAWLPLQVSVNRDGVSLLHPYGWGHALDFGVDGDAVRHKQHGWAIAEELFTWTEGAEAILRFNLSASDQDRHLRIRAGGLRTSSVQHQRVTVLLDDEELGQLAIGEIGEHSLRIPAAKLASPARHLIKFLLPDATAPSEDRSGDLRLLGIQVFSARID